MHTKPQNIPLSIFLVALYNCYKYFTQHESLAYESSKASSNPTGFLRDPCAHM